MKTVILKCTCVHEYQDSVHGPSRRVHNLMKGGLFAKCTVCGTKRDVSTFNPAPITATKEKVKKKKDKKGEKDKEKGKK